MHGYPHQIMRGKDRSYVVFDWVYLYSLILFVVDRLHIQPYIIISVQPYSAPAASLKSCSLVVYVIDKITYACGINARLTNAG